MEARLRKYAGGSLSAVRSLDATGWAIVAAVVIAVRGLSGPGEHLGNAPRIVLIAVCFTAFTVVLVRGMLRNRQRRRPLAVLLTGIALWCAGALTVVLHGVDDAAEFPLAAKVLVLLAYVAFATYLMFDVGMRGQSSLAACLEVMVICGGTASLASSALLLPVSGNDLGSAVLSVLVPLFDVMLALLVLAQVAWRARPSLRRALPLSAAFTLFAFADVHFIDSLSTGTHTLALLGPAARIAGFAIIVRGACRPAEAPSAQPAGVGGALIGAAAAIAVAAMALRPAGSLGLYVAVPAGLTLLGAGGRLVLALRQAHRAVEALARSHTDDLTQLPNRRALRERIDVSRAGGTRFALVVLDLDGFKDINDTLGHTAGDQVLQRVGTRIREAVPAYASVARLGGDEFGILTPRGDSLSMLDTAQEVLAALSRPLRADGIEIALNASVGIVDCYPDELLDSNELVRRAEVAMYRAKHARSGIALYDPYHDDFSKAKLRISEELRRGIQNGELEVWYQPQIDASTLRPCALEALVRWRHPTDGLLMPIAFLPAARRAGLMPLLSQEVVRLAVADVARWHAAGLHVRVALNCAPPELLSGVFVPRLHEAVTEAHLPPGAFVVEVTEESFIAEPERAREILQDAHDQGIGISIDDYGTGFSSLAYLRDLPVDELKLDRTFVSPIGTDERSRMIVASTVQMARALGLRTVAEGVEDAATAADLIAMGVGAMQGYHISRPMPAEEVVEWMVQWPTFADVRLTVSGAVDEPPVAPATRPARVSARPPRRAPHARG